MPDGDFDAFLAGFQADHPFLPEGLAWRYARQYGTRARRLLEGVTSVEGLGRDLGQGLHEIEAHYLRDHEWAETEEDMLWRRTKLGLQKLSARP
jgi:glycerol-3-phosphate dehydrogenase